MDDATDWAQMQWNSLKREFPDISDETAAMLVQAAVVRSLYSILKEGIIAVDQV